MGSWQLITSALSSNELITDYERANRGQKEGRRLTFLIIRTRLNCKMCMNYMEVKLARVVRRSCEKSKNRLRNAQK